MESLDVSNTELSNGVRKHSPKHRKNPTVSNWVVLKLRSTVLANDTKSHELMAAGWRSGAL